MLQRGLVLLRMKIKHGFKSLPQADSLFNWRISMKPGHFSAVLFTSHLLCTSFLIIQLRGCHHFNHKLYVLWKVELAMAGWGDGGGDGTRRRGALAPCSTLGLLTSRCVPSPLCLGSPASLSIRNASFELKRSEYDERHPRLKPEMVTASSVAISYILS